MLDSESKYQFDITVIDQFTTAVFAFESILKAIAFGFIINGDDSYLRNPWNAMDFVIMVLSIISLTPLSDTLQFVKMLRILRILRLIGKNDNLKVAVKALL